MISPRVAVSILLSLWLCPFAAAGQVYKWIDEKGVVNYTTTPPSGRRAAAVDVAPAVAGQTLAGDGEEARYWRARSERETASAMAGERARQETESLRQARLRQEMADAEAAKARQRLAEQRLLDQCRSERRVDCESGGAGVGGLGGVVPGVPFYAAGTLVYPYPVFIVNRRPVTARTATTR